MRIGMQRKIVTSRPIPETIDHIGELGGNWLLSAIQQTQ
jgi:hypothetical protein